MTILKHIDFQVPGWGELQQGPVQRMSYRGEVLSDSPLMYLRMGEGTGPTAIDETGQHDAVEVGSMAWGVSGPLAFDAGTAVDGAGTGGLAIGQAGWLPVGASERTLEAWFKPTPSSALYRGMNYGQASAGRRINFSYTHSEISIAVSNCRFGVQSLSLSGQWHHTALVFPDGATRCDEFLIYLDGQRLSPSVIGGVGGTAINTTDSALLINQFSSSEFNNCAFGEVAIYGTALTDQRIDDHYQAGI